MIYRYGGSLASVCLLIAVMVFVRLVAIGIRTVRPLCLTSKLMLWICVVLSLILFGICFLQGRRIAKQNEEEHNTYPQHLAGGQTQQSNGSNANGYKANSYHNGNQ